MYTDSVSSKIPSSYVGIAEETDNAREGLRIVSTAELPTRWGDFIALGIQGFADGKEHITIVKGDIVGKENILTRVHSECLTSEVLGSLRCDCREQLEKSMQMIEDEGEGLLIYLRQEGRGIGLINKIKAYQLQDFGLNTVEANRALGFDDDLRTFTQAVEVINLLDIESIRLMTNNPRKINGLQEAGIEITERIELITEINDYNRDYLMTKKKVSNHLLDRGMDDTDLLE